MTPTLWNVSVTAIQSTSSLPLWLQKQAKLPYADIMQLPELDVAGNGSDALPSVEEELFKADYLEFLREQIKLEPRGPEWGAILRRRLTALEPFANKKLITAIFFRKPDSVSLKINPKNGEVIHMEIN